MEPEKVADLRVKYLEMLQGVVVRMASQCATTKNFCVTLTTASCALALTLQKPLVALLGVMPITICSLLDAQFLKLERQFRGLFDRVRVEDWNTLPNFEINSKASYVSYWSALSSWSIVAFYLPLLVTLLGGVLIAGYLYGQSI